MAFRNKILTNPHTRQDIKFLQTTRDTNGQLLEMESTYHAFSKEPPGHYHPNQEEDFTVLQGELSVRMDGLVRTLKQGDTLHIPKNKIHSMWNNAEGTTIVNWKVQPAMDTEYFLETAVGLINDGKTTKSGMPKLLQVALMANKYADVFRLAKPPFGVQKALFLLLTPLAYLAGFRPTYKKYLD